MDNFTFTADSKATIGNTWYDGNPSIGWSTGPSAGAAQGSSGANGSSASYSLTGIIVFTGLGEA